MHTWNAKLLFRYIRVFVGSASTLLLCALLLMRAFATDGRKSDDAQQAEVAAASTALSRIKAGVVYVSINGREPYPEALLDIQSANPAITIVPSKYPSPDVCRQAGAEEERSGPCDSNHHLDIQFLTEPLWRIGIVNVRYSMCSWEVVEVKLLQTWRIMSVRGFCA